MEQLKLWTTTVPKGAAEKARSLTARAGETGATLRRVVSDSDLKGAAKGMGKAGKLRAAATASIAFNRMRALAEAAKKVRRMKHEILSNSESRTRK